MGEQGWDMETLERMRGADLVASRCARYIERAIPEAIVRYRRELPELYETVDGICGNDATMTIYCRVARIYNVGFYQLFAWSSRVLRMPHVEVGRHMRRCGTEFLQVPIGTYAHLRRDQQVSVVDDDDVNEYMNVYAQGVAVNGESLHDIDMRIQ